MKGRRPPFWNGDTQIRRATQASKARKKRLAAPLIPPEPPPSPADAPQPAAEAMPVGRTVGMMEAVTEAWAARRMALYEQPSQRLPLLSGGVQDPPTTTSTLTEPAAEQRQGEQALPTTTASAAPPTVPPSAGDTAGSAFPDPTGQEGAEAKAAAGSFARDVTVGLQGAEAKSAAGELTISSALTAHATVQPAAKAPPEPGNGALPASTEQRPAAYRFTLRDDGKIDVLAEAPEPQDRGFAIDLYGELVRKTRDLHRRLDGTNVAPRARASIGRLLTALGTRFDDLRPALLLSHELSIAADRSAFSGELSADIIAMMDDVLQTLMYLLAAFPGVRPIEAARAALYLDRNPDAIPAVRQHMMAIKAAAEQAGVATEAAISALGYNDAAIEDAADPVERTGLIGHSLLICRNFVAAAIDAITRYGRKAGTEVGELVGNTWREIKNELPKGAGEAARAAPIIALVAFAGWCLGPASAITQFKPLAQMLKGFARDEKAQKQPKRGKDR
jgi:hypothetical protein